MKQKSLKIVVAACICSVAIIVAFFLASGAKRKEGEHAASLKTPPQSSGYTVTVSEEEQRSAGIMTMPLKPGLYRQALTAYGEVLSPEGLNELAKNYLVAGTAHERAQAQLKASEAEYRRLQGLNGDKNISDKELEAAAARFKADRAEAAAAAGALTTAKSTISFKWSPTVAGWVFGNKPALRRVFESNDVLVRITVPPSLPFEGIPGQVLITTPAGSSIAAKFVSRATSTNPAIQGVSFMYLAPSRTNSLVPGMNVTAQLPSTEGQRGFIVSASAVVWLQDKAWVYVKKSATGFARVAVPTTTPVAAGYFVSGSFTSGDQVVTRGAQALLSAESTPKAPGGGGGDEEDED